MTTSATRSAAYRSRNACTESMKPSFGVRSLVRSMPDDPVSTESTRPVYTSRTFDGRRLLRKAVFTVATSMPIAAFAAASDPHAAMAAGVYRTMTSITLPSSFDGPGAFRTGGVAPTDGGGTTASSTSAPGAGASCCTRYPPSPR